MATASPPLTPPSPEPAGTDALAPLPQLAMTGADILDWILGYLKRFVSLSPEQGRVVALWVVHTHSMDAADTTPYLSIHSAEKQSGKTRLLEVLKMLVRRHGSLGACQLQYWHAKLML